MCLSYIHMSYSNMYMNYSNMHMSYSDMHMSYSNCVCSQFLRKYAYFTRIAYNTRIVTYKGMLRAYHKSMFETYLTITYLNFRDSHIDI